MFPDRDARRTSRPTAGIAFSQIGAARAGRSAGMVARRRLPRPCSAPPPTAWDEGAGFRERTLEADPQVARRPRRGRLDGAVRSAAVPAQPRRRVRAAREAPGRRSAVSADAVACAPGARCATSTTPGRPRCCSSPPTASARSTWCCPTRSPTRAACSPACSLFWFERTTDLVANHLRERRSVASSRGRSERADLAGRAMLVKRADVIPVECVARGYLSGLRLEAVPRRAARCAAWRCPPGSWSPTGCPSRSSRPRRRPPTGHDLPLTFEETRRPRRRGPRRAAAELTLAHLRAGRRRSPLERGIIVADTKFEFGFAGGELILIDEVGTPDSSRFWPADGYEPGGAAAVASTSSTSATGWMRAAGTASRRRRTLPGGGRRADGREVPRGLRAAHGRAVRPATARGWACRPARSTGSSA